MTGSVKQPEEESSGSSISKYIPTSNPDSGAQLANILPKAEFPKESTDEE